MLTMTGRGGNISVLLFIFLHCAALFVCAQASSIKKKVAHEVVTEEDYGDTYDLDDSSSNWKKVEHEVETEEDSYEDYDAKDKRPTRAQFSSCVGPLKKHLKTLWNMTNSSEAEFAEELLFRYYYYGDIPKYTHDMLDVCINGLPVDLSPCIVPLKNQLKEILDIKNSSDFKLIEIIIDRFAYYDWDYWDDWDDLEDNYNDSSEYDHESQNLIDFRHKINETCKDVNINNINPEDLIKSTIYAILSDNMSSDLHDRNVMLDINTGNDQDENFDEDNEFYEISDPDRKPTRKHNNQVEDIVVSPEDGEEWNEDSYGNSNYPGEDSYEIWE